MTATVNPAIAQAIRADRQFRSRKRTDALIRLGLELLAVFVRGLWMMLAVGIVHHQWIHACPTIGYGSAVALAALLSSALWPITHRKS